MRITSFLIPILLLIPLSFSSSYKYCVSNQTLRVVSDAFMNGTSPLSYTKYEDYPCISLCTNSTNPPSCAPTSMLSIWVFLVLTLLSLFLMFMVPSGIVNIIGSMMLMVEGGYILIAGIDFVQDIGLIGTSSATTINNQLTYIIGFILICLSLFRIAVAYSKMKG